MSAHEPYVRALEKRSPNSGLLQFVRDKECVNCFWSYFYLLPSVDFDKGSSGNNTSIEVENAISP